MFQEIKRIVQNCGETSPADRHPQDEDSSWILFEGLNLCHPWAAAGGVDSSDSLIANKATLSAYLCGDGSADDRGQLEVKLDAYCCAPPAACECLASWEDPSTDSRVEVSKCLCPRGYRKPCGGGRPLPRPFGEPHDAREHPARIWLYM